MLLLLLILLLILLLPLPLRAHTNARSVTLLLCWHACDISKIRQARGSSTRHTSPQPSNDTPTQKVSKGALAYAVDGPSTSSSPEASLWALSWASTKSSTSGCQSTNGRRGGDSGPGGYKKRLPTTDHTTIFAWLPKKEGGAAQARQHLAARTGVVAKADRFLEGARGGLYALCVQEREG